MSDFCINHLDHIAIRVKDLNRSAKWYHDVLGLVEHRVEEWGGFPIFMVVNKTAVALFPITEEDQDIKCSHDHFAFNVDKENFNLARKKYEALGLKYIFQDHHYFHSIYTKDPDGHTVELTTLVMDEKAFYKN